MEPTLTPDTAPQTPPPAAPDDQQGQQSWMQAAAPQQVPTQPAPGSDATIAPQPTPQLQQQPVVITPQKRTGLLGVVDDVADALTGTKKPTIGTDQQGNKYVQQTTLTHGEQWMRIGGELLSGAANGLAAGRGGNHGAAAAAGVATGEHIAQGQQQQQKDMTAEARQQNLDNANNQMLRMNLTEQAMRATRLQVDGTQHDIAFSQAQTDRYVKDGGTNLGVVGKGGDLAKVLKINPDVMADMIQHHLIETPLHYDENGKVDGVSVIKMPSGYRTNVLPAGAVFHTFDSIKGEYVEHHSSDPILQKDIDDYDHAAQVDSMKFKNDKIEQDLKTQHAEEAKQNAASKKAETPSIIAKNNAQASEASAKATKTRKDAAASDANDPEISSIGEAVASGRMTVDQVPGFGKKKEAIEAYLAQHHPNLDLRSVMLDAGQRRQVNLAGNAIHNLDAIGAILQRRPDLLGVIQGRVSQGKELAGTNDPDLAAVDTALDNYALAATGAHGVRAVKARADTKAAVLNDWKNGPKAIQSSIATARGSLANLASAGSPRGTDGQPYQYKQQPAAPPPAAAGSLIGDPKPGESFSTGPNGTIVYRGNQWVDTKTGKPPAAAVAK